MSQALDLLMKDSGNSLFHTVDYMRYISTHLKYLKENGAAQVEVAPGKVYKFEYNFFSLLVDLGYNAEDYIPFMLINGFKSPADMTREFVMLTIPDPEVLSYLKNLYRHQNKRV